MDEDSFNQKEKWIYTAMEAAKLLRVGKNTIYEGIKRGEIPSIRIGNRLLIPRVQLHRLLSGQLVQGEAA